MANPLPPPSVTGITGAVTLSESSLSVTALATATEIPSFSSDTAAPSTSTTPNNIKQVHTSLSAGPIAGAVIGSTLVLAIGITILIRMYRRRRGRRYQQVEALGRVSPLQQNKTPGADGDLNLALNMDPSGITHEKGHHNSILKPQVQVTSTSEIPQSEPPPTLPTESHLIPTSTQIQEGANQDDMRGQAVRMDATIGRMSEQIRRLESQLALTGDGHSDKSPPTYVSRDGVNHDDMRARAVRTEVTIGRMAEYIRILETQLALTGDGHSDRPPPTYVSS